MILHNFLEFVSNNTHTFSELLPNKSNHIFRVHTNITDTFRESTHFSRHQIILTFSESYSQTILQTFPDFISLSNTEIFKTNNTAHFSWVYIKQYWQSQKVPSKLSYSKTFLQSSYHAILTLSESYYQTILTYSELISNSNHTFKELLPNISKHFFESLNGHLHRKFSNWKLLSKSEKN